MVWTSQSSRPPALLHSPCWIGKSLLDVSGLDIFLQKSSWLSKTNFRDQSGGWVTLMLVLQAERDIEPFTLPARFLMPRLGIHETEGKGSSAHACEEAKGQKVGFERRWLSQCLILEIASSTNSEFWAGMALSRLSITSTTFCDCPK